MWIQRKRMIRLVSVLLTAAFFVTACGSQSEGDLPDTAGGQTGAEMTVTPEVAVADEPEVPEEPERVYVAPEMKGEVTVNVYRESEYLEMAAELFMTKYPDIKVIINTFAMEGDTIVNAETGTEEGASESQKYSVENYLAQLNTQIMSGSADDIIYTPGLPMARYSLMGVFEDLSFFMENSPEFTDENYYMNVFGAMYNDKGQMFEFPLSVVAAPVLLFEKKLVDSTEIPIPNTEAMTYREAIDYATKLCDASTLKNTFLTNGGTTGILTLAGDMTRDSYGHMIDFSTGTVNINNQEFIELLKEVSDLKERYQFLPLGFDFYTTEAHIGYSVDYGDIQAAYMDMFVPDGTYAVPLCDTEGRRFMSEYNCDNYAINAKSLNKELAWEFLKFMTSDEVQTLPSMWNAGVNKKGLAARVENYVLMAGGDMEKFAPLMERVEGWVMAINGYRPYDAELTKIVYSSVKNFGQGSLTAEEAAAELQRKVDQYLNE